MDDPYVANNIYLVEHHLVLMLPRKSACTSIKAMAQTAIGLKGGPVHDRVTETWQELSAPETPADVELIGAIREPLSRLISAWRESGSTRKKSFDEAIQMQAALTDEYMDVHFCPQAAYCTAADGRRPTSWLYVECLLSDWMALCRRKGWAFDVLAHRNAKKQTPVPSIDRETLELIHERWAEDFVLHRESWVIREGIQYAC